MKQSQVKGDKIYVYEMFSDYVEYLKNKNLSRQRIKMLLHTSRRALNKAMDIKIDKDTFKDETNDSLPDQYSNDKTLITSENIKTLIYAAKDLKLKTVITVLGSTGMRISELLRLKYKYVTWEWTKTENDIDVPPYISIPAHITKTRRSRKAYLTNESVQCLMSWLDYKYRDRRYYKKPSDISESYIFRMHHDTPSTPEQVEEMEKDMNLNYRSMYFYLQKDFKKLVEQEGLGEKFRNNNHSVSIHSLRHYVITTVEELTNVTSAYFWAGKRQVGYIFNDKDPQAILDLYKTVESRLTFLNPKVIKQTDKNELKRQQKLIDELTQQMRQQRKEILLLRFKDVIDDMIHEKRHEKNQSGISISPEEQLQYFKEYAPRRFTTKDDLELIQEMIDENEIKNYYEESDEEEEATEKFYDRFNQYHRLGKIDLDPANITSWWFDDQTDDLHIKAPNKPEIVLPPLSK
jgi:integrase